MAATNERSNSIRTATTPKGTRDVGGGVPTQRYPWRSSLRDIQVFDHAHVERMCTRWTELRGMKINDLDAEFCTRRDINRWWCLWNAGVQEMQSNLVLAFHRRCLHEEQSLCRSTHFLQLQPSSCSVHAKSSPASIVLHAQIWRWTHSLLVLNRKQNRPIQNKSREDFPVLRSYYRNVGPSPGGLS